MTHPSPSDIVVNDRMQTGYRYLLCAPMGQDYGPGFTPHYTPREMLEMGVFEGRYLKRHAQNLTHGFWARRAKPLYGAPRPAIFLPQV